MGWIDVLQPDADDITNGRGRLCKQDAVQELLVWRVRGPSYTAMAWGDVGEHLTISQEPGLTSGNRSAGRFELNMQAPGSPDTVTVVRIERAGMSLSVRLVVRVTDRGAPEERSCVSLVFTCEHPVIPRRTAEMTIWCPRDQDMLIAQEVSPSPLPDPRRALYAVIAQDEWGESPASWDDVVEYAVGWRCPINFGSNATSYDSAEALDARVAAVVKGNGVAVPLFLYSHGGYRLSTSRTCRWDSGQIGWALLTKAQCKALSRGRKICDWQRDGEAAIRSIIGAWDQYFSGDVWGVRVYNALGGEIPEEHIFETY
jgi:hypothetical protein